MAKVMFLAEVAQPRNDGGRGKWFDRKLGICPFTFQELTNRRSQKREAGVMVTKVIEYMNQEVSRQFLIEKLLPTIK